jgi:hypothetical protein
MVYQSQETADAMGELHNKIVALVDACKLSPPEVLSVLRILEYDIERLFSTAVKAEKKG